MNNSKITAHPPIKKPIDEFILGAEKKKGTEVNLNQLQEVINFPWLNPSIRQDVQKVFTVKLPEEFILKIKYISDTTNKSQQKIVREILCNEVDKIINKICKTTSLE